MYIVARKRRAEFRRRASKPISIARAVTAEGGGSGPHFYRVEPKRRKQSVEWLGTLFGARADEDLWVELTFYPSKRARRTIIKRIWKLPEFVSSVAAMEALNSKRPRAWALANAQRERI